MKEIDIYAERSHDLIVKYLNDEMSERDFLVMHHNLYYEIKHIDNRKDKLETLAKLLAKTWFYCDWRWESPNERVMQMLMQDLGLYPFKNEDEAIQQTQVDDELYLEAKRRVPTYGKLSEDLVENKLDLSKMESKLDEVLANETSESIHKWLESKLGPIRNYHSEKLEKILKEIEEDEYVEKLAEISSELQEATYTPPHKTTYKHGFIDGHNKAKETLYTEEQMRRCWGVAYGEALIQDRDNHVHYFFEDYIQSLKQPKK